MLLPGEPQWRIERPVSFRNAGLARLVIAQDVDGEPAAQSGRLAKDLVALQ